MYDLEAKLNEALKTLGNYSAVPYRSFKGSSQSAGFKILENSDEIAKIDIDIKENPFYETYSFGEIIFRGSNVNKILADKISSISTSRVFSRCKDVVDIYALSSCVSFDFYEINKIIKYSKNTFADFSDFLNREDELRHAYNKLKRIDYKPDFDVVYDTVKSVIAPFINRTISTNLSWNPQKRGWIHEQLCSQINGSKDKFIKKASAKDTPDKLDKTTKHPGSFSDDDQPGM